MTHIIDLRAAIRRKRPIYQHSTPEVTAENILNKEFTAVNLNEKWCTDVTEMKYGSAGEKLYLSAILDLNAGTFFPLHSADATPANLYL